MIYTLDTNVLVDALRQPAELRRLKTFLMWALPSTVLSSIVAAELKAGARTEQSRALLDDGLLAPFDRRRRIVAPSSAAWQRMGGLLARIGAAGSTASRQNDVLLAVQAREHGWTVITRDRDLNQLRTNIAGLRVGAPYPERP